MNTQWIMTMPESMALATIKVKEYPTLQVQDKSGASIIRIEQDGTIFWKEREVESDADFKSAMLVLGEYLRGVQ